VKNNKSPGYVELTTSMVKAAEPTRAQWLSGFKNLDGKNQKTGVKELLYQSMRRERGNNVEINKGITLLYQTFQIYEEYTSKQNDKRNEGKTDRRTTRIQRR
jgi:hypothetical protein